MSIFNNKLFGKTSKELVHVLNFLMRENKEILDREAAEIKEKFNNEALSFNDKAELHIRLGLIKAAIDK